jgi:large subunit ribosomal protein L17
MKHVKKINNFGSSKGQRNAALNNLAKDLIKNEFVRTTVAKARAVRAYVDSFISKAKVKGFNKSLLVARLKDEVLVNKVLDTLVPRFKDLTGGYIEEYKIGPRSGDGAEMIKLMFKGFEPKSNSKLKKVKKDSTKESKQTKTSLTSKANLKSEDNKKDQVAVATKQRAKSRSGL